MLVLLLALQGAAPAFADTQVASGQDVVVYGQQLDAAYRACVSGHCTVLRDTQVSIALAEQQLRAGAYVKAKKTMAAALNRNKGYAATNPKPVAALYEAYATVSLHEGDTGAYRRAVAGQVGTLRDNLPANDPAVRAALFATGDMWLELGNPRSADAAYAMAERQARDIGDQRGTLLAGLRRVGLAAARGDGTRAARMLRAIKDDPAAADPAMQTVIRVVALRIAARAADDATMERLVADIGHEDGTPPQLIWQPDYPIDPERAARQDARKLGDQEPTTTTSADLGTIQWADIGFWISPDGRTREAEVLRGSTDLGWTRPLLDQIAGRRYSGSPADGQGLYRVERFSRRPVYIMPTGSLIRRRAGPTSLEILDLTAPSATPTAPR